MGRLTLLLILTGFFAAPVSAQTLEGMREEVREEKEEKERPRRPRRPRNRPAFLTADYDDEDEGFFENLTEKIFLTGFTAPFWGPRVALADPGGPGFFPKYPYGKHDGSLLFDESRRGAHSSLLVFQGDYGTDFDSLSQAHGRIFGERDSRIGFDTEFFYRREELRPGTDQLWHGDFNPVSYTHLTLPTICSV